MANSSLNQKASLNNGNLYDELSARYEHLRGDLKKSECWHCCKISRSNPIDLRLCSIVFAELTYGAHKSQRPAYNLSLVSTFSSPLISLPFDDKAADWYGKIRVDLEAKGLPIGPNDTMIAAIGLQHDLTVVTHNTSEFARVSGLKLDDWQR